MVFCAVILHPDTDGLVYKAEATKGTALRPYGVNLHKMLNKDSNKHHWALINFNINYIIIHGHDIFGCLS